MPLHGRSHHTDTTGSKDLTKCPFQAVLVMVLGNNNIQHLYISQLMEALAMIEADRSHANQELPVPKVAQ